MSQESTTDDKAEATNADAWTIKRLIEWTSAYFKEHGSESPRLDAEILLATAIECQRIQLYTQFDVVPPPEQLARFRGWVKRHADGEPVAYLVGHQEFYSLRFVVNSHVLIPRPETEHAVVAVIECAKKLPAGSDVRVVDVGTGSGCIAISLAKHLPNVKLIATDISDEALNVARGNAETHGVQDRIEFINCNLLDGIGDGPVHIIVSNPPYIGTDEQGTVDENVRKFEPDVALFSGADGMQATTALIEQAAQKLEPGGFLVFETSPFIVERCIELINANARLSFRQTIKDLGGHKRVVVAEKSPE